MPCSIKCANSGVCDESCSPSKPITPEAQAEFDALIERMLPSIRATVDKTRANTLYGSITSTKPTNPKDAVGIRKAPMSTVPANVLAEVGVGLLEGATKYGRHNYREAGVRSSVYYDAALRHLFSWWEGEDIDPDTVNPDDPEGGEGLNHITKAICALVVFRDAQLNGKVTDDRPPRVPQFYPRLNKVAAAIIDKNAHIKPKHYTHLAEVGA
jgi:hypothetical protein